MIWEKKEKQFRVSIKSWCSDVEKGALKQAVDLACHERVFHHVALMPDCHQGYGMPIGGVIACEDAVIPNAVGVDIGCGMSAVETNILAFENSETQIKDILTIVRHKVPLGEGHSHKRPVKWPQFQEFLEKNKLHPGSKKVPVWLDAKCWELAQLNLGTLGGGNHFIELQKSKDGFLWLMLHSGSRNLGYRIASAYQKAAQQDNEKRNISLPARDLAYLESDSELGQAYIRDMEFALSYALENRKRMMQVFKEAVKTISPKTEFLNETSIHHNYAAQETHFGRKVWVHRKGATSAQKNQRGIIPGSMGTSSYIVEGKGNPESFMSCSHGAGRKMGRMEACRRLSVDDCRKAMRGIVFDGYRHTKSRFKKKNDGLYDLEEAPLAYKDIDVVISQELDLIDPVVKLTPLGVLKG